MITTQIMYAMMNNPNPMMTLIAIITFTILASLLSFMSTINYWMSFMLIITYIGGLMILFLYIISLMPNSKQKWSNLKGMNLTTIIITMWMSMGSLMMKSPTKNILMSYLNNPWNLMMIMLTIMVMTQMASKIIFLPFKMMKSTY